MKQFFLFGTDFVDAFENKGVDGLLEGLNKGSINKREGAIHEFELSKDSSVGGILSKYDGWNKFTQIGVHDYLRLKTHFN